MTVPQLEIGGAWSQGVVPVVFKQGAPRAVIEEAADIWERTSAGRVRFVARKKERAFVLFRFAMSPASAIGCLGMAQSAFLPPGADVGTALHELGHVLGLHHEHSRFDRDQFVEVFPEHAASAPEAADLRLWYRRFDDARAYDYASVMHYPAVSRQGGAPILLAKQPGAVIGLRAKPSRGDLESLALLYPGRSSR